MVKCLTSRTSKDHVGPQVVHLVNYFRSSEDRVEVVVLLYPRMQDPENVWQPIYSLQARPRPPKLNFRVDKLLL